MAGEDTAPRDADADVIVVGAGLGGLSCALDLAEAGRRVLVVEARDHVGGRTASWNEAGMEVESGLHRFLGYYRALPRLLHRVGVRLDDIVAWEDEFEIRLPDGGPSGVFGLAPLYRPLRTARWAVGNRDFLSPGDRIALARLMAAGLRDYWLQRRWLDRRSTADYARSHGASEELIHKVLVPLTAGILFFPPDRYSAQAFFGLLARGFLRPHRIRLGAFRGGMTEVMCAPIATAVERLGGEVRTGWPIEELSVVRGRARAVAGPRGALSARHVVVATPLSAAQRLVGGSALRRHPWFRPMLGMPTMPAATIQLELDRPSMDRDRTTFGPGTALGSFAEQSRTTFPSSRGRLSVILVPPEPFMDRAPEEVLPLAASDLRRVGLPVEGHVRDYRVIRYPADFYSLAPGHHALRPTQDTPVQGLSLAGDYTRQPWLATMEGAVVSGRTAARVVLGR